MRRAMVVASALATIASVAVASPGYAAPKGTAAVIVAHTDFTSEVSDFDATLAGCESGTVVNGTGGPHFTPWGGSFVGTKVFTCAGGEAGFTVRLTARFGPGGSTGSWTVQDAWGGLNGMKGSGSLVGIIASATVIDDVYTGTVR
jgi:hypothetical protein